MLPILLIFSALFKTSLGKPELLEVAVKPLDVLADTVPVFCVFATFAPCGGVVETFEVVDAVDAGVVLDTVLFGVDELTPVAEFVTAYGVLVAVVEIFPG